VVFILGFFAGMILNLIFIPVAVVIGLPGIFCLIVLQKCRVHRVAKRNIRNLMSGKRELKSRYILEDYYA
jgi:uncharacterized membrane protein (Fun14 family)